MNFLSTYTEGARRMWMDYEGYGMGWHWLGWLGMAFFWLVLVLLVLAAVKYLMGNRRSNAPDGERKPDALAILEERYARGEIDREEFLKKRDDLNRG
ncbi:SHOCT domain-containing protein [Thiobacillus sp.]|jgi:putative membrane protein|uniref:SHOCT domain-containing protein n=1 Tax=Thiobacillus sp. TaxID=924 RepID=UPI0025D129FE|nr:SHOCT domain-containing protein [Thiobacillus sp.]MDZ7584029.1 SHOCT domain-containing protein [Thiobacillus sp.]